MRILPILLTAGALCGLPASPARGLTVPAADLANAPAEKTLAPYFQITGGDGHAAFPLQRTEVDVTVSGSIADITVEQVYANHGPAPIEALYVFPASTRAAVHGMELQIGERRIAARIQEKEQAKATYTKAKEEKKSAALLEQQRPNVFQMSVANIAPGEEVKVHLHYTESVVATDHVYEFVFPTVVGPRYSTTPADSPQGKADAWVQNPYLKNPEAGEPVLTEQAPAFPPCDIRVHLRAGMPVQSLLCPTHGTDIAYADASSAEVSLQPGAAATAGNRDFVVRYQLADKKVSTGLLLHQGEKENFYWLTVQPPARVTPAQIPVREYLFIVDVSGSMSGFPLNTAKELLGNLVGSLAPDDTFNVMLFASASDVLSPQPLAATRENIRAAQRLIDENGSRGGGTDLLPALERAFRLPGDESRSRSIILITDGYVDCEKRSFDLVRNNLGRANFFAFGIGSSVNRFLIEGLARTGRGEPFVVLAPDQCADAARAFYDYVRSPVLTDVKVEFDGFAANSQEPPSVPDVFADRPVEIFGKWSGKPEGRIRVSGLAGREKVSFEFDVAEAAAKSLTNPAVRTLWARERVRSLADYAQVDPGTDRKQEITNLGLTYDLLTDYTSFVAVDDSPRPELAAAETVRQPLPLPQGVANAAVGGTAGTTPEPGGALLLGMAVLTALLTRHRPGSRYL